MNELAQLGIIVKNNKAVVNSLDLSRYFDKEHYLVIRNIESLIDNLGENAHDYFVVSEYKDDSGKKNKMYIMNRDGFTLSAMGFTGAKALKFKTDYIKAFNYMESVLIEKQSAEWKQSRQTSIKSVIALSYGYLQTLFGVGMTYTRDYIHNQYCSLRILYWLL